MRKYTNATDIILIAFSAFVVVWGMNALLRRLNMGEYQA